MFHPSVAGAATVRTSFVLAVALAVLWAGPVRAQYAPVWSDSFAVSGNSFDVNYQYNNGIRQSDALAPLNYAQSPAGTDYRHELGSAFGANLLLKGDSTASGMVSPNYNFKGLVNGLPVTRISFQVQMALTNNHVPNYTYAGFSLGGNATLVGMMSANPHFGVRLIHDTRYGAGDVIQFFDGATKVGPNYGFPSGVSPTNLFNVMLLMSDASDGDPWNGVGATTISMYVNSVLVASYTKSGGGYANNYVTLEGGQSATVANGNLGLTTFGQLTVASSSTNIYISSSGGNDFNYGNDPAVPLASFDNLDGATLLPGTTIYLKRGDVWPASLLHVAGKGTPGKPITLTAYGEGPSPRITGANLTNAPCVQWENPSHVNINSLDLRNAKVGLFLRFTGSSASTVFNNSNVVVTACHFENMNANWASNGVLTFAPPYSSYGTYEVSWGAGIWLGGRIQPGTSNNVLDGLTVTHCAFKGVSTGLGSGFYWPDTPFRNQFTNVVMEDCWSSGTDNGIFALHGASGAARRLENYSGWTNYISSGTSGGYLQGCVNFSVSDSEFKGNIRNRVPSAPDGCGFDFEGNNSSCSFSNNVIHNNDGQGILVMGSDGDNTGLTIINNTWYNNARNASGSSGYELNGTPGHNGTFSNNGVYPGAGTANGPVYAYDNVNYWNYYSGWSTTRFGTPYSSVSGRPLAWDFASSVQGWSGANQWSGFGAVGGALVGTSTGGDPFVYSAATWVNTREYRWVRVRMSQTAGSFATIYFQTETAPGYAEGKTAQFPIIADGQMRDYIVPVGPNQNCHGVVTGWRLDPTDAAGSTMVIDAFEAMRSPYVVSVTPVSANILNVSFNQAMLPDNGVFTPANYALSGSGRGSLASQPDSVSLFAGSNGPVYQLKWNTGSMYAAAATLSVFNAQNSRGISIWSGSQVGLTNTFGPAITRPAISSMSLVGNNLIISGRDGMAGLAYLTLTSTNLAAPMSQWTPVATNVLSVSGNFSFTATNAVSTGVSQQFYRLQVR